MPSAPLSPSAIQQAIDNKTKPVGALGRVEALAAQIASIQQSLTPRAGTCSLTIFAADHGIAEAGVSAYPQAVTQQMVANFLNGGAAATVFARSMGVRVQVVDAGVAADRVNHPDLIDRRLGAGTANSLHGPAMTPAELETALTLGTELGSALIEDAAAFGEMGIGNTASASLVAAKILGQGVEGLTGRGTGLDDQGLARKAEILKEASTRTSPTLSAHDALQHYGGYEIAMMAGAMIGAAATGRIVIVDGFIATVAALAASHIDSGCAAAFVYAHCSAEVGHHPVLEALDASPLLDLDMRLGEGTGALLAWPIVKAAAAMLRDMASFDNAGVSGPV